MHMWLKKDGRVNEHDCCLQSTNFVYIQFQLHVTQTSNFIQAQYFYFYLFFLMRRAPVLVHNMHITTHTHTHTHRMVEFSAFRSCQDCKVTNPRLIPIPILLLGEQGLQHLRRNPFCLHPPGIRTQNISVVSRACQLLHHWAETILPNTKELFHNLFDLSKAAFTSFMGILAWYKEAVFYTYLIVQKNSDFGLCLDVHIL